MRRGWGVHDASDELARLSLDGGPGIASEKQPPAPCLRRCQAEQGALSGDASDAKIGKELSFDAVDSSFLPELAVTSSSSPGSRQSQLATCFASNNRLLVPAPVGRPGARALHLRELHTSPSVLFKQIASIYSEETSCFQKMTEHHHASSHTSYAL